MEKDKPVQNKKRYKDSLQLPKRFTTIYPVAVFSAHVNFSLTQLMLI